MLTDESGTNAAAIAIRLTLFCPANLRIWFIQAEAQFSRRGITASRMKYEEIVCALPTKYAKKFQDLLIDPPEENPYEKLKGQLISRIADLEHQKIRKLLTAKELGDCKPRQLLRKMQQLLRERMAIDNSFLRELFLQLLQVNVQLILASADDMTIDKLAKMADRIMDAATLMLTAVNTSTEDDCIRQIFREEFNTAFPPQHRSCPRSLSTPDRRGRNCSRRRSTSRSLLVSRAVWGECPKVPSTMHGEKSRGQPLAVTSAADQQMGRLLYVTDRESRLRFLVDTGFDVCIIPPSKDKRKNLQNPFGLLSVNNLPIGTYGTR